MLCASYIIVKYILNLKHLGMDHLQFKSTCLIDNSTNIFSLNRFNDRQCGQCNDHKKVYIPR